MELDYKMIGNRISELRKKKGMTQAVLAELSEIEPSHISHIERAATKLSLPTLVAIANALEVTLDELVYNNLSKSTHVSSKIIAELIEDCSSDELFAIAEIVKAEKKILRMRRS